MNPLFIPVVKSNDRSSAVDDIDRILDIRISEIPDDTKRKCLSDENQISYREFY